MPVVAAGLEGRLPEAKDFADAAVLILGMGVAGKAAGAAGRGLGGAAVSQALQKRLQTIHGETGLTPERVARETAADPALRDALLNENAPLPEPFTREAVAAEPLYQEALRTMYDESGSVKMTFRDTGVEPSFTDRTQLRGYLESLDPKALRMLREKNPQDYLAVLKAIVRKFFPTEGGLRFRRGEDGRALDYEHFVGRDFTRDGYIGSLPSTLKKQDIRVEFTTSEGEAKAYWIRKYLDQDTQKDVWDMLVVRDGELKTKIARTGRKGASYFESQILGAGKGASPSASTGGATESASTPRGENRLQNRARR